MRQVWFVGAMALVACGGEDRTDAILALTGDPVAGEAVYTQNCAVCHAASGLGEDDPTTPGTGENLTEAAGETENDEEFIGYILNGKEEMTPFADLLTDQQIADVLAYVHDGLFAE